MTFKNCKVVMLTTNKKTNLYKDNGSMYFDQEPSEFSDFKHLYFLSDDEIKDGDWFYTSKYIRRCEKDSLGSLGFTSYDNAAFLFIQPNFKKIIATTDKLPYQGHFEGIDCTNYLPQPSHDFIKIFVKEYNKGNIITDVLVEYENCGDKENGVAGIMEHISTDDNTISIKQIKTNWTYYEHCVDMQYYMEYCQMNGYVTPQKWLSDLKHY